MDGLKNATPDNAVLEVLIMLRLCFTTHHHLTFEILSFAGYAWENLPDDSLVINVVGGVGAQSLTLTDHHPHLRSVVQDRESATGDAIEVCVTNQIAHASICCMLTVVIVLEELPDALESGRVQIQSPSFFAFPS